jgi:hypothetical protein
MRFNMDAQGHGVFRKPFGLASDPAGTGSGAHAHHAETPKAPRGALGHNFMNRR